MDFEVSASMYSPAGTPMGRYRMVYSQRLNGVAHLRIASAQPPLSADLCKKLMTVGRPISHRFGRSHSRKLGRLKSIHSVYLGQDSVLSAPAPPSRNGKTSPTSIAIAMHQLQIPSQFLPSFCIAWTFFYARIVLFSVVYLVGAPRPSVDLSQLKSTSNLVCVSYLRCAPLMASRTRDRRGTFLK
jgi:hypothetical protein